MNGVLDKNVIYDTKDNQSIAIGGWVLEGSLHDLKGKEGFHHMFEHMLLNIPKLKANYIKLKKAGCIFNAFTSHEITCFYIVCIKKFYRDSMTLIENILFNDNSIETLNDFNNEKKIILQEIEYHSDIITNLKQKLLYQMFPDMNFSIMGNASSIHNISKNDIVIYYNNYFLNSVDKFITVTGIDQNNMVNSSMKSNVHLRDAFKDVEIGKEKIINNLSTKEGMCYVGLAEYCESEFRKESKIMMEFIKDRILNKLREELGIIYRIDTSSMNFSSKMINFYIFKVDKSNVDILLHYINKVYNNLEKIKDRELEETIEKINTKSTIKNDNSLGRMLQLGYKNTILKDENEIYKFKEYYDILNKKNEKVNRFVRTIEI